MATATPAVPPTEEPQPPTPALAPATGAPASIPPPPAPLPSASAAVATAAQNAPPAPANVPGELQESSSPLDITPVPGTAALTVGGKSFTPQNFAGHFERVAISPGESIPVRVAWPEGEGARLGSGNDLLVHAIHGGRIDGGTNSKRVALKANGTAEFTFTANREPGLYSVLLRRGRHEEVLEVWVPTARPESDPPALR